MKNYAFIYLICLQSKWSLLRLHDMLVLVSKIEGIDTFKATNLHKNAVKTNLKNITIIMHCIRWIGNCIKTIKVKKKVLN